MDRVDFAIGVGTHAKVFAAYRAKVCCRLSDDMYKTIANLDFRKCVPYFLGNSTMSTDCSIERFKS